MSKEIEEMVIQVALAAIQVIARETTAIISELARNRFLKKKSTDVLEGVEDVDLTLKNHPISTTQPKKLTRVKLVLLMMVRQDLKSMSTSSVNQLAC